MSSDDILTTRRRRARFRSWHRGMREADLILGPFADRSLDAMPPDELHLFEALLDVPDADLMRWLTGEAPVPAGWDIALFHRIAAFARSGRGERDLP